MFIPAPPNTLNYVSGDLPKCQGHSTRHHTAAQGRTVRVLFEKSKIFVIFHDFSLISQGPPGGFQTNFENFWPKTQSCDPYGTLTRLLVVPD